MHTMRFLILIEPTTTGFSAWSPDLPGCVAAGATREETEQRMGEAVAFHVDGLKAHGSPIPQPSSSAAWVEVAA